jgi:4-carboxymuconolactone decarboxylase
LTTLNERYEKGQSMRALMSGGDISHYSMPGIDQLAPDLKRIIDEALFGSIWTRPALDIRDRGLCTISALLALGQLPLLRRNIERALNLHVSPEQIVEVIVLLTFYVGVPAVEAALRITKEVFEEQGVEFIPTEAYDADRTVEQLYESGAKVYEEHIGGIFAYYTDNPTAAQMQRLIYEYHWGAIYTRPHLDAKIRAMCSLAALTVQGRYDRQIRIRIEGALRVGVTPAEIMEVFMQVMLYGGYISANTVMQIAGSVFTEHGLSVDGSE